MPGSLRFLLILGCLGGLVYGAVYALSTMRPEQSTVVKQVPSDRLFR
ncbi:histidine kinase [Rhodoligotrophos defluvii]|nr:histidine kinase [Rhodoligotrophos defluvii]